MNPQPTSLTRRTILRGLGVGLALPTLEVFGAGNAAPPQRFLAIQTNMGILPQFFFPKSEEKNDLASPYLDILKEHRKKLTAFSGVSHPEVDGGHTAEICFLTAAPHPGRGGFRNTISVDQFAAEHIGHHTRFPSLSLGVATGGESGKSLSYTSAGVQIPAESSPSRLFRKLFVQGSPEEVEAQIYQLQQGQSILDSVAERARQLQRNATAGDKDKLDQYFTGVRELEQRLAKSEEWEHKPKKTVDVKPPQDVRDSAALIERTDLMYDLSRLAFEADATRLITIFINQNNVKPNIPGVEGGTHPLTHHGNQPEKLDQLRKIEEAQFGALARLLEKLSESREAGTAVLDQTSVLYGTCMGSANAHSNSNLPVVLAGGGFRHGQQLAFDTKRNYPLPNLFVSLLQRLGIEADEFASGKSTFQGLEMS